ncbi:hypothetical protein B0H14DRAFT_3498974 [Mycena olivaceomarginata]|nr:hypothetical protein B0H14DRAFT_3498974 [Mycena olivaceomarginata]
MSFRPSIEEINKDPRPPWRPSLLFSNHILQDSDDPDLPADFHRAGADWSIPPHPSAASTAAGPSRPPLHKHCVAAYEYHP